MALLPPINLFDAHTHIGVNDPDTFKCTAQQLLAILEPTRSRAVAFAMHEPDGYPPANDQVLAAADASEGRLVAFARVDPRSDPVAEIRRCAAAGARGVKLHPRAEGFEMNAPGVREIVVEAHELRLPILIHAGRGIPALGRHVLEYATEFPRARFILAHAGVSDLAWIWQRVDEHSNVFFDTAWWSMPDLLALFAHVAPSQILYATDIPFGAPAQATVLVFRSALQAGLDADQLRSVAGAQLERLVAADDALDVGPAPGPQGLRVDPMLARVSYYLVSAIATAIAGASTFEFIDLARLACDIGDDRPQAQHCSSILSLLELARRLPLGENLTDRFAHIHVLVTAAALSSTPDVPV